MLLVTHSNDQDYERILFLLLYELLQQYLLLQSSQWHTIVSKQFYLYEETGKEPSDKADGVETIVYLLQFVLFHLPGLEVTLSGNTVEENILAYFCTMLSDRLRAEPYLFNTYIYLLAAIASTSSTSADAVYAFIDKAPSEHVSWPIMVNALNEAEKLLQSEGAQRGLLDPDLTGFIAILTLLKSIILNTTSCPTIRSSLQENTIQVCLKLLHQPIHVVLKAKLCEVLAAIAREESYAKTILKQLEYGRILTADSNTGIAWELESVETAAHDQLSGAAAGAAAHTRGEDDSEERRVSLHPSLHAALCVPEERGAPLLDGAQRRTLAHRQSVLRDHERVRADGPRGERRRGHRGARVDTCF